VAMAYATGRPGFGGVFPPFGPPIAPQNVCMIGIRSVDPAERPPLAASGVVVHDMRAIDERGIAPLLDGFLRRVAAAGGALHVSFDVDFLDPAIAPGVGTTIPGGATFREAHLVMEMLHDSGLVASLDLVELNPFLDERGRTALLLVDLVASLMGRSVLDRPTHSY
jgi:arginase